MEKINFVNNTTPALNATNLNKLQQNVEDDIGDLSELNTTSKDNIVNAINEVIVESGSNSNGSWIKYSNGTLIQYGEYTQSSANTTTALPSGGYRSSGYNVDFPIEFYEIPGTINVVSSGGLIDNGVILANANTTKTYFQILWWSVSAISTVQAHKATWIAIGKWK